MGLFSVVGSILGGGSQKKAAKKAAAAQVQAAQLAIDEQRRQFDKTEQNLSPFLNAGTGALDMINALLGISTPEQKSVDWGAYVAGNPDAAANWASIKGSPSDKFGGDVNAFGKYHYEADGSRRDLSPFTTTTGGGVDQAGAINSLKASPLYQSLYRNGEDAVLSNAAATGGLRGGNTQNSLAHFGADTLAQVIQQQLANLGGIATMGQNSGAQLGTFGANMAGQIGQQLTNQGQARAGAALAKGGINAGIWNNVGGLFDEIGSVLAGGGGIKDLGKVLF